MSVSDLEKQRSQYAFKCVKNANEFTNEEEIFTKYLEKKFLKSKEKNEEKRKQELKEIQEDIESFLAQNDNFKKLEIKDLKEAQKSFGKDYKSYVKKTPMMILNNGLGSTIAFIYSKKKDGNAYELIYKQINDWFVKHLKDKTGECDKECFKTDKKCEEVDLVEWIICLNSSDYRAVTNEVLALFNWLKRFADGMIEDKKDGEG